MKIFNNTVFLCLVSIFILLKKYIEIAKILKDEKNDDFI